MDMKPVELSTNKEAEMIYKKLLLAYAVLAMTGCASVVNEVTHPIKVETFTSDKKVIAGAECKLTNDR